MVNVNRRQALTLGAVGGIVGAFGLPVSPASAAGKFKDVPDSLIFSKEINWLADKNIIRGWSDGTFRPLENIKRDAFAAFLYRIKGEPAFTPPRVSPFRDVTPKTIFYKEILWCHSQGILNGWKDGTFRPLDNMLRDAAVVVFYRMSGSPDVGHIVPFKDTKGMIFEKEMYWARKTGLMNGWAGGTYRPLEPIKRDAAAALIYRYMNGGSFGKGIYVNGGIAQQYFDHDGIFGVAKKPLRNERREGIGFTQEFQGAYIAHSKFGTHTVHVPGILATYKRDGFVGGKWGFPTSGDYGLNGATYQNFQGGLMRVGGGTYYLPNDNHSTFFNGSGKVLKYGTAGTALVNGTRVRYIWESMRALGYVNSIPRTSSMTFNTTLREAVKRFQRRYGLGVDGVVGAKTWAKMTSVRGHNHKFNMDSYLAPTEARAKGGTAADRIEAMRDYFKKFEGKAPYTWGGAGYTQAWAGFDCSGLVYQMMAAGGIVVRSTDPYRHAQKDFRSTQAIYNDKNLRSFPLSQRRNGDIITFSNSPSRTISGISHDGFFYDGQLYHAWSGGVTRENWNGGTVWGARYPMPYVKRPFF